ncbi:phosphotransferase [Luteimicrobium sp. NPDC057192]|uniref:phosphotransferase n=1 Tax=Luteimicrobium sp. NPDC057192 TaxID=3346042 RepID=UPI003645EA9F
MTSRSHVVPHPSGGRRLRWRDLPASLQAAVEDRLGGEVVREHIAETGFSPGLASVLVTTGGTCAFVKAAPSDDGSDAARLHRTEARVAGRLPEHLPVPRLLWVLDDGDWVVAAYEAVEGRTPSTPWEPDELAAVLAAVGRIGTTSAAGLGLPDAATALPGLFVGWQNLWEDPDPIVADLAPWAVGRIDELVDLAAGAAAACEGDAVVHGDLRADNLLVTDGGVVVVDWPHAVRGAPFFDVAAFLPSVGMQGIRGRTDPLTGPADLAHRHAVGAELDALFRSSPSAAGADDAQVLPVLAGITAYFLDSGRRPPVLAIPRLRAFQRAQGAAAAAWLEVLIGRAEA